MYVDAMLWFVALVVHGNFYILMTAVRSDLTNVLDEKPNKPVYVPATTRVGHRPQHLLAFFFFNRYFGQIGNVFSIILATVPTLWSWAPARRKPVHRFFLPVFLG